MFQHTQTLHILRPFLALVHKHVQPKLVKQSKQFVGLEYILG
jgi:hypothetical protein